MKKIPTVLTSLFTIVFFTIYAQDKGWDWAIQFFGDNGDFGYDLAVDQQNNYLVTGNFLGDLIIGDTTLYLNPNSSMDAFLTKISSSGEILWTRHFRGISDNSRVSYCRVTTDSDDNIFIAGSFLFTMQILDTILVSQGNWDIFIAKFNADGDLLKLTTIKGPVPDYFNNQMYWHNGLYIGVEHNGLVSTDAYTVYGNTDTIFLQGNSYILAKFDGDLNYMWHHHLSSTSPNFYAQNIEIDPDGNPYMCAIFWDSIVVQDTVVYPEYDYANFIQKLDTDGNRIWMKQLPKMYIRDYKFDQSGNMFCAFLVSAADTLLIIGNDTIPLNVSVSSMIVAKFDPELDNLWYFIVNDDYTSPRKLEILESGNFLLAGWFRFGLSIGDTTFSSNNVQSFIAEFDTDGSFMGGISTQGGTPGIYNGNKIGNIAADHCGNLIVTGTFNGAFYLGADTLYGETFGDVFIARYLYSDLVISLGADTTITFADTLRLWVDPEYDFYQWQDGSSANYFDVIGSQYNEGTYLFWVIAESDGCFVTDSIWVTIKEELGYSEIGLSSFNLFPNPANDHVFLQINNPAHQSIHIHVYDLFGNELISPDIPANYKSQTLNIYVSNLKPGIYIMWLSAEGLKQYHKLIISR